MVAFQVSGRPLLLCLLVVLLFCARAPYGDCHGGHRGLREADGQFTHRLVWHVVPVLCAAFPFFLGYVVVPVGVVPVGEVAAPVLRVEGLRVRVVLVGGLLSRVDCLVACGGADFCFLCYNGNCSIGNYSFGSI